MNELILISNFFYFLLASLISFTIPGIVLLEKYKFTKFEKVVLGTGVGIVIFGIQAFFFGYLLLRWMTYVYAIGFLGYFLYNKLWKNFIPFRKNSVDYILVFIIFPGVFFTSTSKLF